MIPPIIYNIFTLLLTAAVAWILSGFIISKLRKDKEALSFGLYILFAGLVFFLQGSGLLFLQLGYPQIDKILFMTFALTPMVLLIIYYHLLLKVTHKENFTKIGSLILFLIILPGSFFLLKGNFIGPIVTDWGSQYTFIGLTNLISVGIFIKAGLALYHLVLRVINWIKVKKVNEFFNAFVDFTLIMIAAVLVIQFSGWFVAGWNLFLVRIIVLASILISYICYTGEEVREKFRIEG